MDDSRLSATALALILIASGCCSKPKGLAGTGPAPAASVPVVPSKRIIPMKEGSDEAPFLWTTPLQSRHAAPAFAQRDGYAPQLSESVKRSLLEEEPKESTGKSTDGGTDPCLVICLVHGLKAVDTGFFKGLFGTSAAELDVHVTIEKDVTIVERGPEDRNFTFVSVPLVDCNARGRWKLHLRDRDGGDSYDDMGTTHVTPPFPTKKKDRVAEVTCRAFERDRVEAELAATFDKTDQTLDEIVETLKVDPRDPSLGVAPVLTRMQRAVNDLAGWIGWADPRVIRRRDRGLRILSELQSDRIAFVTEKASQPAAEAIFRYGRGEYGVSVGSMDCDATTVRAFDKPRTRFEAEVTLACVLPLRARNLGDDSLGPDLGGALGWKAVVARSDGETFPLVFLGFEGSEVTKAKTGVDILEPGAKATVLMGIPAAARSKSEEVKPVLVVMNPFMSEGPVFLPLSAKPE